MDQRKKHQGLNHTARSNAPALPRPVAPPVYRPQPVPKVLQAKPALAGCQPLNKNCGPGAQTKNHNLPQSVNHRHGGLPGVVNRQQTIQRQTSPSNSHQHPSRPHVTKPVVQRMEVESFFDGMTDDLVLVILEISARERWINNKDLISFSITSKRMFQLVTSDLRSINGILRTYCNTLEPLLHGAHLDVERLGLPGSGTILGLALNGRLIPWEDVPKKFTTRTGSVDVDAWEGKVARKVSNYSEYSIQARPDRESIQSLRISPQEKKALQKQSQSIMTAREHSPAKTFKVFLLLNKGATSKEAEFTGQVKSWLSQRSDMLTL